MRNFLGKNWVKQDFWFCGLTSRTRYKLMSFSKNNPIGWTIQKIKNFYFQNWLLDPLSKREVKHFITLGTMATYDLSFASQILLWKTKGHWGVIQISSSINTDSQVVSGIAFINVTNKSRSISFSLYFVWQIVLLKFWHCFSNPGANFVTDPDSNGASRVTLHNLF